MLTALLTGGGLVAAGAVISGVITGLFNSRTARDSRKQDRLDKAYIEVGQYLSRFADWARSVQPFWGLPTPPDPLSPGERWHIEALVTVYGSPEVRSLLEAWQEQARKIEAADDLIRRVERSPNPSDDADKQARDRESALSGYKAAMQDADQAIRAQMWKELGRKRSRYERASFRAKGRSA